MLSKLCPAIAIIFVLVGCVGERVRTELSIDHPANPQAAETVFMAPPNPFQEDVAMPVPVPPTKEPAIIHDHGHGPAEHHMNHRMEHGTTPESPTHPTDDPSGHQDVEHQR